MTRVGTTISPAASTSGRCSTLPVYCRDLSVFRLSLRPRAFRASRDAQLTLGRRVCSSSADIIRCSRVTSQSEKRAPLALPLAAISVNAAGVIEAEIVTADAFEEERRKSDAVQAAIAAVKAATQGLQAHFDLASDGTVNAPGEWDGFTVRYTWHCVCRLRLCRERRSSAGVGS